MIYENQGIPSRTTGAGPRVFGVALGIVMTCGFTLAAPSLPLNITGMKNPLRALSCLLLSLLPTMAEPPSKGGVKKTTAPNAVPAYKEESPLPKGWPEPGPFNQVVRKKYPAYRAAFTPDASPNSSFRRLFKHISRNKIPMTAPVEMKMDDSNSENMDMEEMAFLYQSTEVGKTGLDGELIEVRDIPALETLSYAWQGPRNKESTAKARAEILAELTKQNLKATGFRLFGYNSPFIPRSKQTHELQALIE